MSEPIRVLASIPPIQSAIKIGQDGMRVQFDIPESEMERALAITGMRNQVLRLALESEGTGKTGFLVMPTRQPEPKGKQSPSQLLRLAIWAQFNRRGGLAGNFEGYYETVMGRILGMVESDAGLP